MELKGRTRAEIPAFVLFSCFSALALAAIFQPGEGMRL
jgi:hypothetical protein